MLVFPAAVEAAAVEAAKLLFLAIYVRYDGPLGA
jgi:hypothetical protein